MIVIPETVEKVVSQLSVCSTHTIINIHICNDEIYASQNLDKEKAIELRDELTRLINEM